LQKLDIEYLIKEKGNETILKSTIPREEKKTGKLTWYKQERYRKSLGTQSKILGKIEEKEDIPF
jgi:hypothetical protein